MPSMVRCSAIADIPPMGRTFRAIDTSAIRRKRNHRRMQHNTSHRGSRPSLATALRTVMDDAAKAQPFRDHTPIGMDAPTVRMAISTARLTVACLKSDNLPDLFDRNGRLRRTPQAAPSSDTVRMDAAVITNSRVASAGAGVVIVPEASVARAVGKDGPLAFERVPGFLRNIEAGEWSTVNVDALPEVSVSPSPIVSAEIDWSIATAKAIRFVVNRKERMRYGDQDELCNEIIAALTLGLARAADEVLLSDLSARALANFTLGAAAAEGLAMGDLRALVGTGGQGAAVGQDGALRAGGIAAELTAEMSGTIVGAWDRTAVAVRDDVNIFFERTGLAGEMAITAWASMQSLVPSASKFWKLTA